MKAFYKRVVLFVFIVLLGLATAWIVWPGGSKIDLRKLKINFNKQYGIHLGLDLQGGAHLVYQADFKDIAEGDKREALQAARDTVERRVNSFGVSEPVVQTQGTDQIVVELPGITDINKAIDQIGQTPLLEFRTQGDPNKPQDATVGPDGKVVIDPLSAWIPTKLSGKNLKKAIAEAQSSGKSQLASEIVVKLQFDDEGTQLFSDLTKANIGKPIAIILDGQIISAPTVQTAITNGEAIVSGNFTPEEAKLFATRLNSGALPVPIKLISQQNVGATLGKESIQKSIIAGLIGLLLVALFMVFFYRFPGLLAVAALLLYVLMSIAIFKIGISVTAVVLVGAFFLLGITVSWYFGLMALLSYLVLMLINGALAPVTLTLAGIAGFILSVGMAVDANILIFERMKEELRAGKDVPKAIEDGFARAWMSIRDSNVSSLITTIILYLFGTPSIKGFAVTLSIGILISMFSAITVTRTLLKLFVTAKLFSHPWLFGIKIKDNK